VDDGAEGNMCGTAKQGLSLCRGLRPLTYQGITSEPERPHPACSRRERSGLRRKARGANPSRKGDESDGVVGPDSSIVGIR
jgi:hypothetical protein